MISYEEFKRIYNIIPGEPEISIYLKNKQYMIIKYEDYVTFQRCGINDGSGEIKYQTLDELYNSKSIDNIYLKEDWYLIEDIIIDEIYSVTYDKEEIEELLKHYNKNTQN